MTMINTLKWADILLEEIETLRTMHRNSVRCRKYKLNNRLQIQIVYKMIRKFTRKQCKKLDYKTDNIMEYVYITIYI